MNFILFSGCLFTTSYSRLNFKFLIFFEFHSERRHFEIIWYAPRHGTAIVGNRKTQPNVQKIYLVFFILKVFHCHCCTISKRKSYFCRLYITILLYLPRSAAEFLNKLIFTTFVRLKWRYNGKWRRQKTNRLRLFRVFFGLLTFSKPLKPWALLAFLSLTERAFYMFVFLYGFCINVTYA